MTRVRVLSALVLFAAVSVVGCGKKPAPTTGVVVVDPGAGPGPQLSGEALAAAKAEARDRLKQVGVALHQFEAANGSFPAGVVGPGNQLGLSWRVQLLPHLGEAELYKQFKLDEPWNSPHNKPLVAKMPKVFEPAGKTADPGTTYLQSFFGDQAFLRPVGDSRPSKKAAADIPAGTIHRGRTVTEISDGTSSTFMVVEGQEPVEWTKPEDLPFVPFGRGLPPVPPMAGAFKDGFHGLTCDGAVHFFPKDLPERDIAKMITINGGEVLGKEVSEVLSPPKPKNDGPKPH